MDFDAIFQAIQKATLPGVWSKGVALAREAKILEDSRRDGEIILRIQQANRPVSPKVTLWPDDDDWHCDCGDRNDPCVHIAAAVVALKGGRVSAVAAESPTLTGTRLEYRFHRPAERGGPLGFSRWLVTGEKAEKLTTSLVSRMGGISSGRIAAPAIPATREDFAIDGIVSGGLDRAGMQRLFQALRSSPGVRFDDVPARIESPLQPLRAIVSDEGGGFRLEILRDAAVIEVFSNGALLCGAILRASLEPSLTPDERGCFTPGGRIFPKRDAGWLVSEILPPLEAKLPVEIASRALPRRREVPPRILIECDSEGSNALSILPRLVYGDPPIAEALGERLELLGGLEINEAPVRDRAAERERVKELHARLDLQIRNRVRFEGRQAVEIRKRLEGWNVSGTGARGFEVRGELEPRVWASEGRGLGLAFETGGGQASVAKVFAAWDEGSDLVALDGGGWARLPEGWLSRYGARARALLRLRGEGALEPYRLPELAALCEELGAELPARLAELRGRLEGSAKIPEAPLPAGLRAELRHYQREGYDWLRLLGGAQMGALLADDMGLGKTLQAICAIEEREHTLVVAPTSVLQAWKEQLERFRPGLAAQIYYGPGRKLSPGAGVVLTTYGILRSDDERLAAREWDLVILDETQTIRNPDSQVARAAFRLRGKRRIALSGTPIENHLEDLWSQFRFLNPGLLGPRESLAGDLAELRRLVRPFILRRLKKDVAPELPPRTETVLECELSDPERELYNSILAASRAEILAQLEEDGRGVFGALEMLLRLRQACCHPALVPGHVPGTPSSKVELLVQTLTASIDAGHRALIFSQWTSLLDLIEPELASAGISFTRLDGSTRNREEVVSRFQATDGPNAMLISLKAGGVGLTLTAADHVFILDPWWNPAAENQAADRAHRIGQENPVLIHRLVARDTVEDRVLALQRQKLELAGSVLEGSGISREELIRCLTT